MKKVISLVCLSVFILAGCSNQESVTGPEPITNHQQILSLPDADVTLEKKRKFKAEINGITGGQIDFSTQYRTKAGKVKVSGLLVIPPGAFEGTEKFTIIIDKKKTVVDLLPSPMTFDIPLKLTLTYEGIDLTNVNPDEINFCYIEESTNSFELLNSAGKIVDPVNETLVIIEAELTHLSRYGWVNP